MCGSGGRDRPPPRDGKPGGNGRTLGRGPQPGSYSPPDAGGRGNGKDEPNRPWWTFDLAPRWARMALAAGIVVFGVTLSAACQRPPDDDDRPGQVDTSLDDNPCADPDQAPENCEDLAP